ncbi:MAG: hypothetical protein IJV18_05040, partial [Acidaminococcaceae bacterium]|nr:hypothetical protein [Acidaminococcaceae bacterium]
LLHQAVKKAAATAQSTAVCSPVRSLHKSAKKEAATASANGVEAVGRKEKINFGGDCNGRKKNSFYHKQRRVRGTDV